MTMKTQRVNRKTKKKLRSILLCHTGNIECRKDKYSKPIWLKLKHYYRIWLSKFGMDTIKNANKLK